MFQEHCLRRTLKSICDEWNISVFRNPFINFLHYVGILKFNFLLTSNNRNKNLIIIDKTFQIVFVSESKKSMFTAIIKAFLSNDTKMIFVIKQIFK